MQSLSKCLEQPKIWPFHYRLWSNNPGCKSITQAVCLCGQALPFASPSPASAKWLKAWCSEIWRSFLMASPSPSFPILRLFWMKTVPPRREFLALTCWNCGSKVSMWWCRCCSHLPWFCWGGPRVPECRQRLNRDANTGFPKTLTRSWWICEV